MPILVRCPEGHQLRVPDSRADSTVACPRCKSRVYISSPATEQALPFGETQDGAEPAASPTGLSRIISRPGRLNHWLSNAPGYVSDAGRRRTAYWLAASMAAMALFTVWPALPHLDLRTAPAWSNIVLLLALLQLAYAAWFALAPDFSTAWVAMFAFGGIAIVYAAATAITLSAKPGRALVFDLGELCRTTGSKPTLWCVAVVLVASLMAYFSGAFSHRWRKSYRLEVVRQAGPGR